MRLIMHPAFFQRTRLANHLSSRAVCERSLGTLRPFAELCTHLVTEKEPTMRIYRPLS